MIFSDDCPSGEFTKMVFDKIKYIINKRINKYRILILNGYNLYFEFDFIKYY
jgi:hypothetical protein